MKKHKAVRTSFTVFLVKDFSTSSPRYLRASTAAWVSFVNAISPFEAPAPVRRTTDGSALPLGYA